MTRHGILPAESQPLYHASIPIDVLVLQIVEQATSLPDQFQETSPRMMILGVGLEMLSEVANALAEQGNLDLRGTGIRFMGLEVADNILLLFCSQSHRYALLVLHL